MPIDHITQVFTTQAPAAIGPYSQGMVCGGLVFTAGQIPLDPASGELIDGDVQTQTRRVLENLRAVLESAGSSLDESLKATVYLVDMADFAALNEVWAEYFPPPAPARSTVQVAALPKGARVEVDLVARARR